MQKYTPVFFSKDDLDVALKDAHLTRRNTQAAEFSAEAAKHKAEFKAATKEVRSNLALAHAFDRHCIHGAIESPMFLVKWCRLDTKDCAKPLIVHLSKFTN